MDIYKPKTENVSFNLMFDSKEKSFFLPFFEVYVCMLCISNVYVHSLNRIRAIKTKCGQVQNGVV